MKSFSNFREINEKIDNLVEQTLDNEYLVEGKVEDLKNKIMGFLGDVDDVGLLHSVLSRLNRKLLDKYQDALAERLTPKNAEEVIDFVEKTSTELEDKKKFMEIVAKGKGLSGKQVLKANSRKSFDSVISDELKKNATYQSIKNVLIKQGNFSKPGSKSAGDGEVFLSILSKDITPDPANKGDIAISGKSVEVKAQGARLRGQHGFAAGDSVDLKTKLARDLSQLTGQEVDPSSQSLSFKPGGGLPFLNKILEGSDPNKVRDIFAEAFTALFPQISKTSLNKWLKKMVQRNGTLAQDSEFLVAGMIFDYYKSLEGFESILFLNSKKNVFQVIQDGEEFVKNQKNFKITGFLNWDSKQSRESVVSVELQ